MSALNDLIDTTYRHVLETSDGGQIRYYAAHRRIYVTKQSRDGRHQITTAIPVERARLMARRIEELCAVTEAHGERAE